MPKRYSFRNIHGVQPCTFLKYKLYLIKYSLYFDKFKFNFIKYNLYFKNAVACNGAKQIFMRNILYLMFLMPFVSGCADDWFLGETQADELNGEMPVQFDFSWPEVQDTRAFDEGTEIKNRFKNGDMIHVIGTFETKYLTGSDDNGEGEYKYGKVTRYGALLYNGKDWVAAPGNTLTWPSVATKGEFEAYYINGSDGVLTDGQSAVYSLSALTPATDPLHGSMPAEKTSYEYGRAVWLNFSHICANLMLVDLEPMVSSSYLFKRDGVDDFHNAFKLVLEKDENNAPTKLKVEFCQVPDPNLNNLVYIASNAIETKTTDTNGKEMAITKANYFLEPGLYETFSLCYPAGANGVYEYLQYDYNKIPQHSQGTDKDNTKPILKENGTYTLTITKSPGVTIKSNPPADGWDESEYYPTVDVPTFMEAVHNGTDYTNNDGIQILEKTANGTKLLHNVDFGNYSYNDFIELGEITNTQESNVFDGDYHYIRHLGCPLFRYNRGTIQNLGITDIKFDATSYEDDNENKDMSRHGALCMRNFGNVSNVRVTNVTMKVSVKSEIDTSQDGSETHNIGCVLGSNTGKVNEVALGGIFSLNVVGTDVNASVLIGGFVGQNTGDGEIYDVSPLDNNLTISITNKCKGEIGSYSIGGIVGESTAIISEVILPNVKIDSSESEGVTSYIGGMAGQLSASSSNSKTTSCNVSGSVRAGTTSPDKNNALTSGSYIGGMAGADLGVPVVDCRTAVSVHGSTNAQEGVIYATGGAFGRIREANTFEDLIAYGSALNAPQPNNESITSHVGNFAGIVPKGQTWENDYAKNNIIVHAFENIKNIGAYLDSNNKE